MAWAADYDQSSDLAYIGTDGLLYQLFYAWVERMSIDINQGYSLPPAGCKPFQVSTDTPTLRDWPPTVGGAAEVYSLRAIQDWIEIMCTNWIVDKTQGGQAGKSTFEVYTLSSFRAAAGLNASGFTRHTPSGTSYGKLQVGDYICPHLFNELKACFKLMTAKETGVAFPEYGDGGANRSCRYGYTATGQTTEALAKSVTETSFDAGPNEPPIYNYTPRTWSRLWSAGSPTKYYGNLERVCCKGKIVTINNKIGFDADFYIKPTTVSSGTWHNNGDFADADKDKYVFCESGRFNIDDTELWSANYLGGDAPDVYPVWHTLNGGFLGWQVSDVRAVRRYANDFVYGGT